MEGKRRNEEREGPMGRERNKEISPVVIPDGAFFDVPNAYLSPTGSGAIEKYCYLLSWYLGNWVFTWGISSFMISQDQDGRAAH